MIKDVQKKLALRAEQQENPALPGLPDEEDAKAIVAMHDKVPPSTPPHPSFTCCCYCCCSLELMQLLLLLRL